MLALENTWNLFLSYNDSIGYVKFGVYTNSLRQTIVTKVSTFRKYVMTSRVFDHQAWSNGFTCWVSRPRSAAVLHDNSRQTRKCQDYSKRMNSVNVRRQMKQCARCFRNFSQALCSP